jgi:hypothetical protein
VWLNANKIKFLPSNIFDMNKNLKFISLLDNPCGHEKNCYREAKTYDEELNQSSNEVSDEIPQEAWDINLDSTSDKAFELTSRKTLDQDPSESLQYPIFSIVIVLLVVLYFIIFLFIYQIKNYLL